MFKRSFEVSRILSFVLAFGAIQFAGTPALSQDSEFHGPFPIQLTKSVDTKKMKDGDEVQAKTSVGMKSKSGLDIPAGCKVFGHVTQAKAKSKGDSESSLGMVFDKLVLPNGKEIQLYAVLQAVAPPIADPSSGISQPDSLAMKGGGGTMLHPGENSDRATMTTTGNADLTRNTEGVQGIKGLTMHESVLYSDKKELKLDGGTRLMVRADPIPQKK